MARKMIYGLLVCVLMGSCTSSKDGKSDDGDQASTITKVQGQATDTQCPNGGVILGYGVDENANGILDDNEVVRNESVTALGGLTGASMGGTIQGLLDD